MRRLGGSPPTAAANRAVDPASSGRWFRGWMQTVAAATDGTQAPVASARTWLLSEGWQRHGLIDLREVEAPNASTHTLRRVAEIFAETERQPESVRVAFVAASDSAFGIARMYQAFRYESAAEMQVFRSAGEARDWLGLDPE